MASTEEGIAAFEPYYGGEGLAAAEGAWSLYERVTDRWELDLIDIHTQPDANADTVCEREDHHDAVTRYLLGEQLADTATPTAVVFSDEHAYSMADQHSSLFPLLAAPVTDQLYGTAQQGINPSVLNAVYAADDDCPADARTEPVQQVVVESGHYFPETHPVDGRHHALDAQGELDLLRFDVSGETPTVTYTEVKRYSTDGMNKVDKQLDRFTAYAEALGWTVETEVAFYEDGGDHVFRCDYLG